MDWNNSTISQYILQWIMSTSTALEFTFSDVPVGSWRHFRLKYQSLCYCHFFQAVFSHSRIWALFYPMYHWRGHLCHSSNQQVSMQTVTTSLFRLWVTTSKKRSLKGFKKSCFVQQEIYKGPCRHLFRRDLTEAMNCSLLSAHIKSVSQ